MNPTTNNDEPPSLTMIRLMTGFWISRAIYVAAKLGIPDLLIASVVCGLLLIGLYVTGRGDPIVSATWGAVLFAFCCSLFLAAVVFRSYAETYSSFRKFLAARQSFYLRLKRQIDSTPAFDVFVYNPRMNVPLVRLLSWLRSNA